MNQEAIFTPVPLGREAKSYSQEEIERFNALRQKLIKESEDGKLISGLMKLLEKQSSIQ